MQNRGFDLCTAVPRLASYVFEQDSTSVNLAYTELLNDEMFRGLKKKAQCREKTNISDFNQCVVGLYNNASLWGFSLGGLLLTLGTAYAVTQKNEAASVIIAVPLIGLGATHIALGGMLKRKANEYEALTGN